ncbi:hypothetical protein BGZ65_010980 [Modicella reniformis]|uniref:Uncharacterized protein n=1 Tax=Modicella reniformis TaxID=1440133 RepID=A0A9P6LPM1_9FUNG|nr:hypothetical protein BGZ65_010980 [Modicella reniformis]
MVQYMTSHDIVNPKIKNSTTHGRRQVLSIDELLEKAKESLLEKFRASKHAPRGTLAASVALAEETLGQDNYASSFSRYLGVKPVNVWRDVVEEDFDAKWNLGVASAKSMKDVHDEESQEEDQEQSLDVETQKNIRTCSATLSAVLRPEIRDNKDDVIRLAEEAQTTVTDCMQEMSCLVHKTTLLVS